MTPSQMAMPRIVPAAPRRAYAVRDEFALMRKIMLDPTLTKSAVAVAGAILEHINRISGLTYLSQETIAAKAQISVSAVKRAVTALYRYIAVEAGGGRGRANIYRLRIEPSDETVLDAPSKQERNWSIRPRETSSTPRSESPQTGPGMSRLPDSFFKPTPNRAPHSQNLLPTPTDLSGDRQPPEAKEEGGGLNDSVGEKVLLTKLITRGFFMSPDRASLLVETVLRQVSATTLREAIGLALLDGVKRDQLPARLKLLTTPPKALTPMPTVMTATHKASAEDIRLRKATDRYESLPKDAKAKLVKQLQEHLADKSDVFQAICRFPTMITKKLIEFDLI